MDKNKKVMKKVLATALSISVFGTAVAEKGTIGSAIWPFTKSHTQEEIASIYEEGLRQIDEGFELVKGLDDPDEAQSFIKKFQSIRRDLNRDDKRSYDSGASSKKEIEELKRAVEESLELQQIKVKDKKKSLGKKVSLIIRDANERIENSDNLENLNRKAEKIKNSIEQMEDLVKADEIEAAIENLQAEIETTLGKEEKVRQLNSELDSIIKDASKKIENPENMDHINSMAAELREEIQQIDNLNRVSGIEVLFGDLQAEIETTLEKEEKVRQLNSELDSIMKDASKKIENLENIDRINSMAAELREKIQQIDNLNRVSEVEGLFGELQAEIETTLEKEEKVRQLNSELDSIIKDASKKIENPENMDRINSMAAELRERIQQIDNLNRVSEVEVLFGELQTEITNVLAEEETIRQENLRRSLEEAKAGLSQDIENLQDLLSKLNKENENYAEFSDMIISYNPERIDSIDNLEGAKAVKNKFESAISKVKVLLEQQIQKEDQERNAKESFDDDANIKKVKKKEAKVSEISGGNELAEAKINKAISSSKQSILISGPPGTGKTKFVEAIAAQYGIKLFYIKPNMVMGRSGLDKLLNTVEEAKREAQIRGEKVIIFFDELDYAGHDRGTSGSNNELLLYIMSLLDDLPTNVIVIAATNRRMDIDPALLRRFGEKIKFDYPNIDSIIKILNIYLKRLKNNVNKEDIAKKMTGFSGAEIKKTVKEAYDISREKQSEMVTDEHMKESIALTVEEKRSDCSY